MKVFLSWTKDRSRQVAEALHGWLPLVVPSAEPWISTRAIAAGQRWLAELGDQLSKDSFGILCLTPDAEPSPWMLFEAGALSKAIDHARVVPYLFGGLTPGSVEPPLGLFQGVAADKDGTLRLVREMNALATPPIPEERTNILFHALWPGLDSRFVEISKSAAPTHRRRDTEEMIEEILEHVRAERQEARDDRAAMAQGKLLGALLREAGDHLSNPPQSLEALAWQRLRHRLPNDPLPPRSTDRTHLRTLLEDVGILADASDAAREEAPPSPTKPPKDRE